MTVDKPKAEFGICEWERRIRAVKRVVISNSHSDQKFRIIFVSKNIEDQMCKDVHHRDNQPCFELGNHTTFEGTPIKVDEILLENSVVFIPADPIVQEK